MSQTRKLIQERLKQGMIFGSAFLLFSCVTKQVNISRPELNTLDEAMKQRRAEFTDCFNYNRAHGSITLQFTLNHLGHLSEASVLSSTLKNPVADACVLKVLHDVNFPPHTGVDLLHVKYPLASE